MTMITEVRSVKTSEMQGAEIVCDDGRRYLTTRQQMALAEAGDVATVQGRRIAAPFGRRELHDAWLRPSETIEIPVRALYGHCPIEGDNG